MKMRYKILLCFILTLFMGVVCACAGNSSNVNISTGMQLVEKHQYEDAMAAFDEAEKQKEDSQLLARGRGIASLGMTHYEEAVVYFQEALAYSDFVVDELDYDINYYMAQAYTEMEDFEKAKEIYTNILSIRPEEVNALFLRGKILLEEGDYKKASADFKQITQIDKDAYDLRIEIAGVLSGEGYHEEGQKYLSDFLAKNEKKLSDYDKGKIYYYMGDYENARVFLEKAKVDKHENTILLLGKTYEKLGDFNYATSEYKNFLLENENSAIIYNQLGLCKLQSGEYGEAQKAFESAAKIENNGMERTIEFNQIVACEYAGDFDQAAVLMKAYLKKYPADETALREYSFLQTR